MNGVIYPQFSMKDLNLLLHVIFLIVKLFDGIYGKSTHGLNTDVYRK